MTNIIAILNEKNQLLGHFLKLTAEEHQRLSSGNFEKLQLFYETREGLLKLIKLLDQKTDHFLNHAQEEANASVKSTVRALFEKKERIVEQILEKDLEIISFIEKEKNDVIKNLRDTTRGKRVLGAYRGSLKSSEEVE